MKLKGYIHPDYLKEIKHDDESPRNDYPHNFWLSKRQIVVWDKKFDEEDIEVVLEIPDKD